MRKKNTEKLGDILGVVLKQNHLDEKLYETRVINSWAAVLGETVNKYTQELYFKNGTLYVSITSSVLRHELFLERAAIKASLNRHVQAAVVKEIIFR